MSIEKPKQKHSKQDEQVIDTRPKLLIMCDPVCHQDQSIWATGHAKILKHILPTLRKSFQTMQIGFGMTGAYQYQGTHNIVNFDGKRDYWGLESLNRMCSSSKQERPDVVLTITDFKSQGVIFIDKFVAMFQKHKLPFVMWIAMDDGSLRNEYVNGILAADKIIGMAEYTKKIITSFDALPIVNDKVSYIYPGVDTDSFYKVSDEQRNELRKMFGWSDGQKVIFCVAKNQLRKNLVHLFAMMRILPENYHLKMISLGVRRDVTVDALDGWNFTEVLNKFFSDVKGRIDINGGEHSMTNPLPDKVIGNMYRASDCFILPSQSEGLGLPFLEAMACGCPSIGSKWGPITELLASGRGLIIENYPALEYYITMGQNPELYANPSISNMAEQVVAVCSNNELRDTIINRGLSYMENINDTTRLEHMNELILSAYKNYKIRKTYLTPDIIF